MIKVAVIMVHHRNHDDTFACIQSLSDGIVKPEKILVIDNSEQKNAFDKNAFDKNAEWIKTTNRGYAAALNMGIKHLQSKHFDFYWLLNNDLVANKNALQNIIQYAASNKRLGIIGSKVLFDDRRNVINAIGGKFNKWQAGGYNTGANEIDNGQYDNYNYENDYVYGAAMFVSKDFIEKVGLLDESFFLYFEELDWAIRAKQNGFDIGYCLSSVVYHKQGASTGKQIKQAHRTTQTAWWQYNNLLKFYRKHYPKLIIIPYVRLSMLMLKRIVQGRTTESKMIFKIMLGSAKP